jgi:hypothetical protein
MYVSMSLGTLKPEMVPHGGPRYGKVSHVVTHNGQVITWFFEHAVCRDTFESDYSPFIMAFTTLKEIAGTR